MVWRWGTTQLMYGLETRLQLELMYGLELDNYCSPSLFFFFSIQHSKNYMQHGILTLCII